MCTVSDIPKKTAAEETSEQPAKSVIFDPLFHNLTRQKTFLRNPRKCMRNLKTQVYFYG